MCIKTPHRNQPSRANSAGPSVTAAARRRTQTAAGLSPTRGSRLQPPSPRPSCNRVPTAPLCLLPGRSRSGPITRGPPAQPHSRSDTAQEAESIKEKASFGSPSLERGNRASLQRSLPPHLSWQPGPRSRTLSARLNSPSAAILRFDFAARRPRRRSLKMAPGQPARGELGARWRRRSRSRAGAPTLWRERSASAGWCRPSGGVSAGSTGSRRYREGRALGAAVSREGSGR